MTRDVTLRPATDADAAGIGGVLQALVAAGKRRKDASEAFARARYIANADRVETTVAVDTDGTVLGFQALILAREGNRYGAPPGWGVIGTHIRPDAARRGIGRALFAATKRAAEKAGLPALDALIGADNTEGLAYYDAMGFRDYREEPGAIGKRFELTKT